MDLDDKLESLQISDNKRRKRRRLSGFFKHSNTKMNRDNCDNSEGDAAVNEESEEEVEPRTRRSGRTKTTPQRWDSEMYEKNQLAQNNKLNSDNLAAIEQYYLDRTIKKSATSLETIFEEVKNSKSNFMSLRKLRRSINFGQIGKTAPGKIKKRRSRASKCSKSMKKIELSLEHLYKKLSAIDKT